MRDAEEHHLGEGARRRVRGCGLSGGALHAELHGKHGGTDDETARPESD